MSKVIIFSRVFPQYHPKAGQQTYFVEKFYKSLLYSKDYQISDYIYNLGKLLNYENVDDYLKFIDNQRLKIHTIRAGNRWKVGDKFSPRVWSGKPYASKQIILAPDIEIKQVFDFEIGIYGIPYVNNKRIDNKMILKLANNDGLLIYNFLEWFKWPKPFKGQIICWTDIPLF